MADCHSAYRVGFRMIFASLDSCSRARECARRAASICARSLQVNWRGTHFFKSSAQREETVKASRSPRAHAAPALLIELHHAWAERAIYKPEVEIRRHCPYAERDRFGRLQ